MTQANFTLSFSVPQSPDAAFAAISNPRAWWSGEIEGNTNHVGDVFTYRYKSLHYSKQLVSELVPDRRVAWQVKEADLTFLKDRTEWEGTTIVFDIARKRSATEVTFTHVGLKPMVECYDACSDAWTSLIKGSLKELIETGNTDLLELDAPAA